MDVNAKPEFEEWTFAVPMTGWIGEQGVSVIALGQFENGRDVMQEKPPVEINLRIS